MHGDPSTVWGVLVIQAAHRGLAPWDLELFTAGRPRPHVQLHCLPRGRLKARVWCRVLKLRVLLQVLGFLKRQQRL